MNKIYAIKGLIGSGKTLAIEFLSNFKCKTIIADKIVHKLYEPNQKGSSAIFKNFGKDYLNADKSVNRKALRKLLVKEPDQINKLNSIIHPLVQAEIIKETENSNKNIFIEIPNINTDNFSIKPTQIIEIYSDPENRRQRLLKRGLNEKEIEFFNRAQINISPDIKIINNSSIEDFQKKLKLLWEKIQNDAKMQ